MVNNYSTLTPQEECNLHIEISKVISNNTEDFLDKTESLKRNDRLVD